MAKKAKQAEETIEVATQEEVVVKATPKKETKKPAEPSWEIKDRNTF